MAENPSSTTVNNSAQNAAPKAPARPANPAFRMMGLPNFRFKLPSRNWMIFLTITGSFTAAVIYDRRQKRKAQQKWSDLVAHISKETLPVEQTRRKLTVFLSAPPGDGLRVAREYFIEYVKPVLVSAALDYEVIEGRKEGEVRAGLAEKIRKWRRQAGEPSTVVEEEDKDAVISETRRHLGITEEPGPQGDIVIGRHTWKEYIRGLHEGWLGPLDPPPPPPMSQTQEPSLSSDDAATPTSDEAVSEAQESTDSKEEKEPEKEGEEKKPEKEGEDKKPKGPTPAYISTAEYPTKSLPATIPTTFAGSSPVQFPHILGFLNTPTRIYRFLTQRHLADNVGREVAAVVLASYARPYHDGSYSSDSEFAPPDGFSPEATSSNADASPSSRSYEQQNVLEHEEEEWHKTVRKAAKARKEPQQEDIIQSSTTDVKAQTDLEKEEREWIDDVVVDPRIAARMRRYVLPAEEEARANRIAEGQEWVLGEGERPKQLPIWQRLWIDYGYGEDPEVAMKKPILGNVDNEDGE